MRYEEAGSAEVSDLTEDSCLTDHRAKRSFDSSMTIWPSRSCNLDFVSCSISDDVQDERPGSHSSPKPNLFVVERNGCGLHAYCSAAQYRASDSAPWGE